MRISLRNMWFAIIETDRKFRIEIEIGQWPTMERIFSKNRWKNWIWLEKKQIHESTQLPMVVHHWSQNQKKKLQLNQKDAKFAVNVTKHLYNIILETRKIESHWNRKFIKFPRITQSIHLGAETEPHSKLRFKIELFVKYSSITRNFRGKLGIGVQLTKPNSLRYNAKLSPQSETYYDWKWPSA